MGELRGLRIPVTGPAGQIAFPLARALSRQNEVWEIARFSQPGSRERVEAAGQPHPVPSIRLGPPHACELAVCLHSPYR